MPKITISPIGVTEEQWKKGFTRPMRLNYKDDAGRMVFVTEGRMVRYNAMQQGEKVMTLTFDNQKRTHTLNFTNSTADISSLAAILKCPYIDHPENKSTLPKLFYIVDHDKLVDEKTHDLKKKISIVNKVNNYSHRDKNDLAFFLGENPVNKSDNELLVLLVDFNNGVMFTKIQPNGMSNIDYFIEKYTGDKDSLMTTVIKKAIFFNIIEKRDIHYYIGSQLVGATVDEILLYLRNNEQMYTSYVEKQVQTKDILPNEVYVDKKELSAAEDPEFVALLTRAAELKVSGYGLLKAKDKLKLKKMIYKKERELGLAPLANEDIRQNQLHEQIAIEDELDAQEIEEIKAIKEKYAK